MEQTEFMVVVVLLLIVLFVVALLLLRAKQHMRIVYTYGSCNIEVTYLKGIIGQHTVR